jgi:protein phosphatase inhibitor 2
MNNMDAGAVTLETAAADSLPDEVDVKLSATSSNLVHGAITGSETEAKKKKKRGTQKHLKWDERAIEEHDLLRGTRMKIDEPNTPFAQYDSGTESDGSHNRSSSEQDRQQQQQQQQTLNLDHLQNRLDSVAAVQEKMMMDHSSSHSVGSDAVEERKQEMHTLEFKEHRKRHYNEFELVRKYREEHPEKFADDDDVDESNDHLEEE